MSILMTADDVVKEEGSAAKVDRQFRVFKRLPDHLKPEGLKRLTPTRYSMKRVKETTPASVFTVVRNAAQYLWAGRMPGGEHEQAQRLAYAKYIQDRTSQPVRELFLRHTQNLKWCEEVHGDLTLENVMGERFIDPGDPRGMVCIENDLGKLGQSLAGWEHAKRGWELPSDFERGQFRLLFGSPAVTAFELSHWIRLSVHTEMHDAKVIAFALDRIIKLRHQLEVL